MMRSTPSNTRTDTLFPYTTYFRSPGALVSPQKAGGTEGASRHACAEASISTFDELQLFNRDRPAVAADQARRGEGGGDHAAACLAERDRKSTRLNPSQ